MKQVKMKEKEIEPGWRAPWQYIQMNNAAHLEGDARRSIMLGERGIESHGKVSLHKAVGCMTNFFVPNFCIVNLANFQDHAV